MIRIDGTKFSNVGAHMPVIDQTLATLRLNDFFTLQSIILSF